MHQDERNSGERSQERLLEDLRRDFPPGEGYEVEAAEWIVVDGRCESIPIATVRGNGVDLTFFPRAPKNLPGPTHRDAEAEADR